MERQSQLTMRTLTGAVQDAPFPIGIYKGQELQILLANASMRETWGKGEDVIGRCYTDILPELAGQEIFQQLREVLYTGVPFTAKNARVDLVKDGVLTTHYFNYNFTPVYDDQGNIFAVMNTGADVTDLQLSRQQTLAAEERLRLAVESADLGTFETRGEAIQGSQRFHQIWGTEGSCTRSALLQRVHEQDLQAREEAYMRAGDTGQLDYEARIVHPDGVIRWIRVKGSLLRDGDKELNDVIGVVQDITEQKLFAEKLRKQVKRKTRELRRSNEDLLQLAHVVSHDLKEPVRKIRMFNNLLKSELEPILQQKDKGYFEKVQRASDRIFMLIDEVLNYSTLTGGQAPVERVDINHIIENILTDLELVIRQKSAVFTIARLPSVNATPILIHQLFYNLINNALKFSKEDEPPRIIIGATEGRDTFEITVSDNGIGIAEPYLSKVFTALARFHPKAQYEGTGLGLSLCKKIVERLNGSIAVQSSLGVGATFRVSLPITERPL